MKIPALAVLAGTLGAVLISQSAAQICNSQCKARELTVGAGGNYDDLVRAFCDFVPGDEIVLTSDVVVSEMQMLVGSPTEACPHPRSSGAEVVIRSAAGEAFAVRPDRTRPREELGIKRPTIVLGNGIFSLVNVGIEALDVGLEVKAGAEVKLQNVRIGTSEFQAHTLMLVSGGYAESVSTTFSGRTKYAILLNGGRLDLGDTAFGSALPSTPLRSEINIAVVNKGTLGWRYASNYLGGFSQIGLYMADSTLELQQTSYISVDIPNEHYDTKHTATFWAYPQYTFWMEDTAISGLPDYVTLRAAYAGVFLSGISEKRVEVDFDYCSPYAPETETLLAVRESSIELLSVTYDETKLCARKSRTPYSIDASSRVENLECRVYDVTEDCERWDSVR